MERLNIKQQLELEILLKKTKTKHFLLSTLNNKDKDYFITKIITLPFFKAIVYNNTKFPLYLYTLKKKSESIKTTRKVSANLIVLDNFILKKTVNKRLLITEEKVAALLKEITGNTKRGYSF
jgi:hypothetical protein